jgi:hypothetical protein
VPLRRVRELLVRELAPELVAGELAAGALGQAIRRGLGLGDEERRRFGERARELLAPYREEAVARVVAERVLPALGVAPA